MLPKATIEAEIAEINDKNSQERAVASLLAKRDIKVKRGRVEQTETNYEIHPNDEASKVDIMRAREMQQGTKNEQLESGIRR